jgi:N utilization substance protein A
VRLANRLVDWNIDVKTEQQFAEMDLSAETKRAVSALFGEVEEEIEKISELPDIPENIVEVLKNNGIEMIEELVAMSKEEIAALEGIEEADAALIAKIIEENVEIVEEEQEVAVEDEDKKATAQSAPAEAEAAAEAKAETAPAPSEPAQSAPAEAGAEAKAEEETKLDEADAEEEAYECPECGARITTDMTACPNCGVGLSFEEEEEEEE